jgi:hypothetical protein
VTRLLRAGGPWLLALTLLVSLAPPVPARPAAAAESIAMPFVGGKEVKIIQGYQGGTHQGRSRFGLDIVLADGSTSGADVVAPADGTITWSQAPGAGNGCVAISLSNGTHSVMMCHVILNGGLNRGDKVTRGQSLGTVGKPGTVGNNGVAHIHYELHKDTGANSPVPFDAPEGMLLEGVALPASSTTAVIAKRDPIVSSNRGGSGRTVPMSDSATDKPAPVELVAASVPSAGKSVPVAASGTRVAVVQGTESCLKVRKQPAADAPVVGCLKEGTELALKPLASGADATWRQTDQGWVSSDYLKRTQAVVAGTGDCLNIREAPKAGTKLLGCLKDGTGVTIVEGPTMAGGFAGYKIEGPEALGESGWAVGKYLD